MGAYCFLCDLYQTFKKREVTSFFSKGAIYAGKSHNSIKPSHRRERFCRFFPKKFFYVDKTELLYQLVKDQKPYFLSRPRRFGKTLLLDTIRYILMGRRDLFEGLWIDRVDYDWIPYPVIRLEMNGFSPDTPKEINSELSILLLDAAEEEKIEINSASPGTMLKSLIKKVYRKYGGKEKVAILIDEYDALIVHFIDNPKKAKIAREKLSNFYSILKTRSNEIGHIFITGVSRYAKASIFSKLNQLVDLTLRDKYSTICGFTQDDVDASIRPRPGVKRTHFS
jgi:hypothetical protein